MSDDLLRLHKLWRFPVQRICGLHSQASQNGESLEGTYPEANDDAVDNYMNTIDPGKTVTVCQVFLLKDTTSDVTLQEKKLST